MFEELLLPVENFSFQPKASGTKQYVNASKDFILNFVPGLNVWTVTFLKYNAVKYLGDNCFTQQFKNVQSAKKFAVECLQTLDTHNTSFDSRLERKSDNWYFMFDNSRQTITPVLMNGFTKQWKLSAIFICLFQIQQQFNSLQFDNKISNTNFATRKELVSSLHQVLSSHLDQLFNVQEYIMFKEYEKKDFTCQLLDECWWCHFVQPEVNLLNVFN